MTDEYQLSLRVSLSGFPVFPRKNLYFHKFLSLKKGIMNVSGSDVSDEGVSFLCGLDDLAATCFKDLETFFARK